MDTLHQLITQPARIKLLHLWSQRAGRTDWTNKEKSESGFAAPNKLAWTISFDVTQRKEVEFRCDLSYLILDLHVVILPEVVINRGSGINRSGPRSNLLPEWNNSVWLRDTVNIFNIPLSQMGNGRRGDIPDPFDLCNAVVGDPGQGWDHLEHKAERQRSMTGSVNQHSLQQSSIQSTTQSSTQSSRQSTSHHSVIKTGPSALP